MAILFLDGCGHLSTQNAVTKYDLRVSYVSGDLQVATSVTRLGATDAVYRFPNGLLRTTILGVDLSAFGVQSYIGTGINLLIPGTPAASHRLFLLRDTAAEPVASLRVAPSAWILYLGSNETSAVSVARTNVTSLWELCELEVSYGASGGVRFVLSGTTLISYTGSVLTSAATGITQACWGLPFRDAANTCLDDFYVINNAGPRASTLVGLPMQIRTHWPNSDTATSAWTPNSAGTHYTQVQEGSAGVGPDGTATYLCAGSANLRDLVGIDSATGVYSANEVALGVQVVAVAQWAGSATFLNLLTELSGTVQSHTATSAVSAAFACHRAVFMSAAGGVTWAISRIDAATIGVEMA